MGPGRSCFPRAPLRPVAAMLAVLAWLFAALAAPAQDLPQWVSPTVNDFAGMLTAADARALDRELTLLREETGVEGTVVTLPDRAGHGGQDGLDPFATRLFNHWGVGGADRNDGFMLLVLKNDREVRIELGRGYSPEADIRAQDIVRNVILPQMRVENPSDGIRDGTEAVIAEIARPDAAGQVIAARSGNRTGQTVVGILVALFFGFVGTMIIRNLLRRNRCPRCGHRGLERSAAPIEEPLPDGGHRVSQQTLTRRCPSCGWNDSRALPTRDILVYGPTGRMMSRDRNHRFRGQAAGSSGFGGGSSGGGGASGRW